MEKTETLGSQLLSIEMSTEDWITILDDLKNRAIAAEAEAGRRWNPSLKARMQETAVAAGALYNRFLDAAEKATN